jgi:hypothetical protein
MPIVLFCLLYRHALFITVQTVIFFHIPVLAKLFTLPTYPFTFNHLDLSMGCICSCTRVFGKGSDMRQLGLPWRPSVLGSAGLY